MNKFQRWEIVGMLVIIGFGTTLHFWFEWTDYWRPVALIAAVNESTWEHFKMAFWPGLIFALIEYAFLKNETKNFLAAKFAGLLTMPIITMILFYGYTSLTGTHMLWADVIVFILSVIGGQWISLLILTRTEKLPLSIHRISQAGLLLMVLAFSFLSYFPLRNFIFAHPETGEYGILSDYDHHDY
ncbi:MAG: DUF6512 family protein [Anaerolineales bacterium]|nr:DUF6512 family protein [Anaerolineales bacterium]